MAFDSVKLSTRDEVSLNDKRHSDNLEALEGEPKPMIEYYEFFSYDKMDTVVPPLQIEGFIVT